MNDFTFRPATLNEIDFLVETIIEAEKSGTDILTYSTVFGMSEEETRKFLALMLAEEVDGCELSISSFLIAECNGQTVAALSAWIEGIEGIPSAILKGNLLKYVLPNKYIERAMKVNEIIRELHIEYLPNTIQIGACYVAKEFRGNRIIGLMNEEIIARLLEKKPDIKEAWVQVFCCNTPSLKTFQRSNFKIVMVKESSNEEINKYLPFNKKYLLKRDLIIE